MTIIETAMPAMKAEAVYLDCAHIAASASVSTLNNGNHPRCWLSQRERSIAWGWSRKKPHNPKTSPGMAAMRSTRETSADLSFGGAYSLMNSADAHAKGIPKKSAISATSIVPTSAPDTPILFCSGCHADSVKKSRP